VWYLFIVESFTKSSYCFGGFECPQNQYKFLCQDQFFVLSPFIQILCSSIQFFVFSLLTSFSLTFLLITYDNTNRNNDKSNRKFKSHLSLHFSFLNSALSLNWLMNDCLMNDCLMNQFIKCVKQSKLASKSLLIIFTDLCFSLSTTLSLSLISQTNWLLSNKSFNYSRWFGSSPKSDLYNLPSPMPYVFSFNSSLSLLTV